MITYTKEQVKNNSPYKCSKCGHQGIDDHTGGGQIADTGDYSDCYCPECGNNIMDDDAVEGIDYQVEGVEYFECPECTEETLIAVTYSANPGGVSESYECKNCGHTYNVSA